MTAAIIKCDENTDDIINSLNEDKYKTEEWEDQTSKYQSAGGIIYRLMQQKSSKVYTPMNKPEVTTKLTNGNNGH